ncbi:HNH endonuclease [Paraburkholderia caribensis]|uniref:HNH endonuclease n=1 Tax=Paraburkholderia caribensis TaxID=75105 RepID=UPI001CAE0B19|nr:HNH endonuclease [Paraburkholderia caribensis]CAG9262105.1 hypothetical protein PCAR4_550028 [Paraburkholderia caribensis]
MSFREDVRILLAGQVNGHCSAPHCGVLVGLPIESFPQHCGEAAHICGSKPGSARYDARLPEAVRESDQNGIWLCPTCHTRADKFEFVHPAELLHAWKDDAIARWSVGRLPFPTGNVDLHTEYAHGWAFLAEQREVRAALSDLIQNQYKSFGRVVPLDRTINLVNHFFVSYQRPYENWGRYQNRCLGPELNARQWELRRLLMAISDRPQFKLSARDRTISFRTYQSTDTIKYEDATAETIFCYLEYFSVFDKYLNDSRASPHSGKVGFFRTR